MILTFLLLLMTAAGGSALTYFYDDDAPLVVRLAAGAVIGSALLGLAGFLLALVFGLNAASVGIAPLTDLDVADLVATGPVGRLMAGFRGHAPLAADAVSELLHRLSALALDVPELAELDLNPLLVTSSGCVAVDKRIRVRRVAPAERLKTW